MKIMNWAICLLLGTFMSAQNTQVVSNGGGDIANTTISLDQTIGELMVDDYTNPSVTLQQGFQNTFLKVGLVVVAKVFLQGPYNESSFLMNDDLRNLNFIPLDTPYVDAAVITNPAVLDVTGDDAIVDWVFLEIRDRLLNDLVVEFRSGLLQRDGDIVDVDGVSLLRFDLLPGTYYLSVNHRNHLGIITSNAEMLTGLEQVLDFTNGAVTTAGGVNSQWPMDSGDLALIAGDTDNNAFVRFSGANNDLNTVKDYILADPGNLFNLITYASTGYLNEDVDLNGSARFSGADNDSNIVKDNVLGYPGNIFNLATFTITSMIPE